jgi:hypothetical protein
MIACLKREGCSMSTPAPETLEREKDKLFLADAELIRRLGVPEKIMRPMLPGLESKYGAGDASPAHWNAARCLASWGSFVPKRKARPPAGRSQISAR